jgi:hypothetical protein
MAEKPWCSISRTLKNYCGIQKTQWPSLSFVKGET